MLHEPDNAELDRRLVLATQAGLPLVSQPYEALAGDLGVSGDLVRQRLAGMLRDGRIRRIGAVPNHYAIGYTANGMSVWDVPDERVDELGERIFRLMFDTASGRQTKSEGHGYGQNEFVPWQLGAVMALQLVCDGARARQADG